MHVGNTHLSWFFKTEVQIMNSAHFYWCFFALNQKVQTLHKTHNIGTTSKANKCELFKQRLRDTQAYAMNFTRDLTAYEKMR